MLSLILIHVRIQKSVSHVFKMLVCEFHSLRHSPRALGICNLCQEWRAVEFVQLQLSLLWGDAFSLLTISLQTAFRRKAVSVCVFFKSSEKSVWLGRQLRICFSPSIDLKLYIRFKDYKNVDFVYGHKLVHMKALVTDCAESIRALEVSLLNFKMTTLYSLASVFLFQILW